MDPEMFTGANIGQKENNLMSSLSQYYKDQSVSHVTGWQGELVEKQVSHFVEKKLPVMWSKIISSSLIKSTAVKFSNFLES